MSDTFDERAAKIMAEHIVDELKRMTRREMADSLKNNLQAVLTGRSVNANESYVAGMRVMFDSLLAELGIWRR